IILFRDWTCQRSVAGDNACFLFDYICIEFRRTVCLCWNKSSLLVQQSLCFAHRHCWTYYRLMAVPQNKLSFFPSVDICLALIHGWVFTLATAIGCITPVECL